MKFSKQITVFATLFLLLFVASFTFPFTVLPDVGGWLEPMFNDLAIYTGSHYFSFDADLIAYHSGEDALGMYINLMNIFVISLVLFAIVKFKFEESIDKVYPYAIVVIRYYLAIILLIYGFDKIYKWQFYYPEPNILYTKVKDIPQDLLFWTTMGTSYSYSLFAGIVEVIPAVFLLFRKTYLLGAIIATLVLGNVFMMNIGFDITVKIFSGFLMILSFVLIVPYVKSIYDFFMLKDVRSKIPTLPRLIPNKTAYYSIKIFILLLFLVESQFKFFANSNFNDDHKSRPFLHGSYEVFLQDFGNATNQSNWQRIHFHRKGYMIIETTEAQFIDYSMILDTMAHQIKITDYNQQSFSLQYKISNDTLAITGTINNRGIEIQSKKVYQY